MAAGITTRHSRACRKRDGKRCNCSPSYEAWVYSKRDGEKIRKTFHNFAEAKSWRADAEGGIRKRTLRAPSKITLAEAAEEFLEGAKAGTIRNRSGDAYKPGTVRSYERALRLRVLPELGGHRLTDLTRFDMKDFVDRLQAQGLNASTIQVTFASIGVIYGHAVDRGRVAVDPTKGVKLPRAKGKRKRITSPEEATRLLAALPAEDRPLWATAMYAGLRRGELRALRWEDVDLGGNIIHVQRSWDPIEGAQETKTDAERKVPIASILRDYLVEHRIRATDPNGLVFGEGEEPFSLNTVRNRALRAWDEVGLEPITPHEARHTYASTMIAAGVNAKAISEFMGHSIQDTYDTYGHLMPGNEAAGLQDAYLSRFAT
jgi:integrase